MYWVESPSKTQKLKIGKEKDYFVIFCEYFVIFCEYFVIFWIFSGLVLLHLIQPTVRIER
jgi:hypothetical protein